MELQVLHAQVSASSARTTSATASAPRSSRTAAAPGCAATGVPKRSRTRCIASRSPRSAGTASTLGRPICALSASGVPSATIRPWSMIPTRSARMSASSRYCVVRNTVTPWSRARRATSSHKSARLCGSSPWSARRGTGSAGGARAPARGPGAGACRRVAAHLAVGRVGEPTRSSSSWPRGARSAFGRPCSAVCRRMCSRPVRSWSSAASCSAAPIASRTRGPSRRMSCPATRALPAVGGSSVVSISTVVDLPAPLGPRNP
jgi:hypothetical protein